MGATFEPAVSVVLAHEGGYCKFANDPGGATNWGISKVIRANCKLQPSDLGILDFSDEQIKRMPRWAAIEVYHRFWWLGWKLYDLHDQTVATKIMDYGVNCNPPKIAIGFAQLTCKTLGQQLTLDSQMGPQTRAAINACDRDAWLREYARRAWARYEAILKAHPEREDPWRRVWWARTQWGVP